MAYIDVLEKWNLWKGDIETGVKRHSYVERALKFLEPNVILAIIGVRRSGKSFIMRQIAKELAKNDYDKNSLLIINFEDPELEGTTVKELDKIFLDYKVSLSPKKLPVVFLDEVHNVQKWEKWARTMHELGKAKLIVSGSSANLLNGELATVLTGRYLDIEVFPLSFKEVLEFKGIQIKDLLDMISQKEDILRAFREFIEFGGFPEVVLEKTKRELLIKYVDNIIYKDILLRYKIKRIDELRALAKFYLSNPSSSITFNSISKSIKISDDTVALFSSYFENAYLIFFVTKFSFSVKDQEKSPKKVYVIDQGLSNSFGFKFSENFGKLMENCVAIELRRKKGLNPNFEFYYWKDYSQKEVDFVIKEGLDIKQLIQVTYASSKDEINKREIKALLKASKELKCNNLVVVTWDHENEETVNKKKIKFIPLWKWLLT